MEEILSATSRQTTELRHLHPKIKTVWRFGSCISGLVGAAIFGAIAFLVSRANDNPQSVLFGICFAVVGFMLFGGLSIVLIDRQFANWNYQLRAYDLLICKGLMWKSQRYIARDRIQHIDINTGPLDRRFGLVQVVVYAAGITGSVGLIPGLAPEDADWLKEQLLATRAVDV